MSPEQTALLAASIAGVLAALAILIRQIAANLPTMLKHVGTFVASLREKRRSEIVTVETVRGMVATLERTLQDENAKLAKRLVAVEGEHASCLKRLTEVSAENVDLRALVASLRIDLAVAVEALVSERHRVAVLRAEYERRIADMGAGGGSDKRALPEPTTPIHVDVVITDERNEKS